MRASYQWLRELTGIDASASDYAAMLTRGGIEVEAQTAVGHEIDAVIFAEVRGRQPHPKKDTLSLVTVWDGTAEQELVCGAPNVPAPGGLVLLAPLGATLPGGMKIEERAIAGVVSRGMLCSESELGIGSDSNGIFVLGESDHVRGAKPGLRAADVLGLRDTIFEISLTPNRPDGLGHIGLAREICALFGKKWVLPPLERASRCTDAGTTSVVEIVDASRCPRYGAGFVTNATVSSSPFWLRYRLHLLGSRSINCVVDATNWVLFEWGHPIHAFDRKQLEGDRVVIRPARAGEKMQTLDGLERTFVEDDLLICDAKKPIAVAGVMGGEKSGVHANAKDIVIEVAYFDPRSVRRTSRRLGLHTDASHRFERGVDPNAVPHVLARALELIANLSGGTALEQKVDAYPTPIARKQISLRTERVEKILGSPIEDEISHRILGNLGCELLSTPGGADAKFAVPTWRPDLTREIDLIEEVARVRGYDAIPTHVPHVRPSAEGTPASIRIVRKLREAAADIGLTEAINYAFLSPSDLAEAKVPTRAVPLLNPLSEERSVLRTSLLPGLASDLRRARSHQSQTVRLFELARVFEPGSADAALPLERWMLGILIAGPRKEWFREIGAYDFYDMKGAVEALIRKMTQREVHLEVDETLASTAGYLHPRRSVRVSVDGCVIGVLGELHPDVTDAYELGAPVAYAEIDVASLAGVSARMGVLHAKALPKFPASVRDVAFVVPVTMHVASIEAVLREAGGKLVEHVEVFDVYLGANIGTDKKSVGFRVTYRDTEATLTDKRVDDAHAAVVTAANKAFGAIVRS